MASEGRLRPWQDRDARFTRPGPPIGELVLLTVFDLSWRAHIASAALKRAGVPCLVHEPYAYGTVLGTHIHVPKNDLDKARRILVELEDAGGGRRPGV